MRRVGVDEHRPRAGVLDGVGARHEGHAGDQHLVARSDPRQPQRDRQPGGAGGRGSGRAAPAGILEAAAWKAATFGPVVSQPLRMESSSSSISSSPICGALSPRWISRRVRWCIAFSVTGDVARYFLAIGVPRLIFATFAAALSLTAVAGAAVITGTAKNDAIFGTAGNDTIESLAGDDAVLGQEGDDVVYGGRGDDFIAGDGSCPQLNRPFDRAPAASRGQQRRPPVRRSRRRRARRERRRRPDRRRARHRRDRRREGERPHQPRQGAGHRTGGEGRRHDLQPQRPGARPDPLRRRVRPGLRETPVTGSATPASA